MASSWIIFFRELLRFICVCGSVSVWKLITSNKQVAVLSPEVFPQFFGYLIPHQLVRRFKSHICVPIDLEISTKLDQ